MAYLDNTEITVDSILTKKGREKLATVKSQYYEIALGDDEIDYGLYEPLIQRVLHFMMRIKSIPILEASPDETQTLRYKLVTLPKGTTKIPKVEFGIPSISVNQNSGEVSLSPTTSPEVIVQLVTL